MLHAGERGGLALKARNEIRSRGQLGRENLHGDRAIGALFDRTVDGTHRTLADLL